MADVQSRGEALERVECREGWSKLYLPLIDLCLLYGVPVQQVKEKFGQLRFYTVWGEQFGDQPGLEAMIAAAETASAHICEFCGEDGGESVLDEATEQFTWKWTVECKSRRGRGWIKSLCPDCREKWEAE